MLLTHCKPIIFGCSGKTLHPEEIKFFAETKPFGFILFQRNISSPEQVKDLVLSLRDSVGHKNIPIFIDEEGGRVSRLPPPHWGKLPPMRTLGEIYEQNHEKGLKAIKYHSLITALKLTELGINGNCAPVLDLMIKGASDAIGDRAFSHNPDVISRCARVVIDSFLSCGVYPIIKHMPGHGRVVVDPHHELPYVDTELKTLETTDFIPFKKLSYAPIAMNCHVVFRALDKENPASLSTKIHEEIYRKKIGYKGLIVSDDLKMGAISIPLKERGITALNAGADVLFYCSGVLDEMKEITERLPDIRATAQERWNAAQVQVQKAIINQNHTRAFLEDQFQSLLR